MERLLRGNAEEHKGDEVMKKPKMPKAQGFSKDMYGHREAIYGHSIMERHHAAWENYCKSLAKCTTCDNTGDVHGFDGSYYGDCTACDSSRQRDIEIVNYSITKNGKDFEIEAWHRLLGKLYTAAQGEDRT